MAMTGSGTKDEPYLVDTVLSFIAALLQDGAYIKVTKDLNCNSELQEWKTIVPTAIDVDMNGYKLLAPYIQTDQYLFNPAESTNFTIHDGYILGVYDNCAKGIGRYITFKGMAMTFYPNSCTDVPFEHCSFINCNTYVKNNNSQNKVWFEGYSIMFNSNFILYGKPPKTSNSDNGIFKGQAYKNLTLDNCRLQGELYGKNDGNGWHNLLGYNSGMQNSVVDITVKDKSVVGISLGNTSYITNTLLREGEFLGTANGYISSSYEEIRSIAHSNEVNFTVVEVKE